MASQFVMHAGKEAIDLQLGDRWYHIDPLTPFEVDDGPFYVGKLIEIYGGMYGLMVLPVEKTRTGTHINIDQAEEDCKKFLREVDQNLLLAYVAEQQTERVARNLPVMPPTGRVAQIIKDRKVDLRAKYNLNVMGSEAFIDPEKEKLRSENEQLRAQVAGHSALMETIMSRLMRVEDVAGIAPDDNKGKSGK